LSQASTRKIFERFVPMIQLLCLSKIIKDQDRQVLLPSRLSPVSVFEGISLGAKCAI
jgi:hypothetical protein